MLGRHVKAWRREEKEEGSVAAPASPPGGETGDRETGRGGMWCRGKGGGCDERGSVEVDWKQVKQTEDEHTPSCASWINTERKEEEETGRYFNLQAQKELMSVDNSPRVTQAGPQRGRNPFKVCWMSSLPQMFRRTSVSLSLQAIFELSGSHWVPEVTDRVSSGSSLIDGSGAEWSALSSRPKIAFISLKNLYCSLDVKLKK
ncbi:hypothetical protein EYF80_043721 [Liparis tanakae]|uniref:Uncharacterized protein n=1 Tax=Liparis tanakae TaxID=230148 RepID=A0A4Z2FXT6_9TELE|nr:hypothetical protein EYF80_043721 [Liparis tanakae]